MSQERKFTSKSFSNQKTPDNLIRTQIKESFDLLWVNAQNILHFLSISSASLECNVEIRDRSNDRQCCLLFFLIPCSLVLPIVEIERDIELGILIDCIAQIRSSFSSNPRNAKSITWKWPYKYPNSNLWLDSQNIRFYFAI